eukprot:gene5425-5480_t
MMMKRAIRGGLVVLMLLALSVPAFAQRPATRKITPVPFNDDAVATVSVSIEKGDLRIGSTTPICFQSSRAGFATLWNIATDGSVGRVFPNAYQRGSDGGQAMRIEGGRQVCAGAGGDSYRFRIDGPAGTEDLYLLWTATPSLQPNADGFASAEQFAGALINVSSARSQDWAVAKTTYDIVPAGGAAAPSLPTAPTVPLPPVAAAPVFTPAPPPAQAPMPPIPQAAPAPAPAPPPPQAQAAPKVFILAMGANVDKLTKPNQDATLFTQVIAARLPVADSNVRLIKNATRADFQDGMAWLRERAGPHDFVFIYFSGHGARPQDPTGTSADGYDQVLIPYDFETKAPGYKSKAIWSQEFATMINAIPTPKVIAVIDTCFSGGVFRSIESGELGARNRFWKIPADVQLEHEPSARPATRAIGGAGRIAAKGLLFAAASPEQSALENAQGGVFTMAFLRELANATSGTMADAFARAAQNTRTNTHDRQTPSTVGNMDVAALIGFVP